MKSDKRLAREQKQGRRYNVSRIVFAVIAAAVVIAGIIFLIETPWSFRMEYESANEKDYRKCLRLVNDLPGVTEVFPKKIPEGAKDVCFGAYNNIGGRSLALSFTAEDAELKAIIDKAEANALCHGTKDDDQVAQALPSNKLLLLDDDALIFVLCSEPYREDSFNHAKLVWVAVDEKTRRISFNAESY